MKVPSLFLCFLTLVGVTGYSISYRLKAQGEKTAGMPQELPVEAVLLVRGEEIELEVAKTPQQQQLGLMFRTFLPPYRGMLFPFQPPTFVTFWMKNVLIPLDMIFVANDTVVQIYHNVPPCYRDPCPVYHSFTPIDYVIEVAGGRARQLNIRRGDKLTIKMLSSPTQSEN